MRSRIGSASLAVAQVLLCQVDSRDGMVQCVHIERRRFLLSTAVPPPHASPLNSPGLSLIFSVPQHDSPPPARYIHSKLLPLG